MISTVASVIICILLLWSYLALGAHMTESYIQNRTSIIKIIFTEIVILVVYAIAVLIVLKHVA